MLYRLEVQGHCEGSLVLRRPPLLACGWPPPLHVLTWPFLWEHTGRGCALVSLPVTDTSPMASGPRPMPSCNRNHLLEAPSLNAVTLGLRASAHDSGGQNSGQSPTRMGSPGQGPFSPLTAASPAPGTEQALRMNPLGKHEVEGSCLMSPAQPAASPAGLQVNQTPVRSWARRSARVPPDLPAHPQVP